MDLPSAIRDIKSREKLSDFFRGKLTSLKRQGSDYVAFCPFHKEDTPSFTIYDSSNRYWCFGCSSGGDIFDYLEKIENISLLEATRSLRDDTTNDTCHQLQQKVQERDESEVDQGAYKKAFGEAIFNPNQIFSTKTESYIPTSATASYCYRDHNGKPIYYVVRLMRGGKKQTLPVSLYSKESEPPIWAFGLNTTRILYNLPEIRSTTKPILIVEGEKCADRARDALPAYTVTTWTGGASSVHLTDFTCLRDKKVYIWPDNDSSGMLAAKNISEYITDCTIVEIPEGKSKGWDIADAIAEGASTEDLLQIIKNKKTSKNIFDTHKCHPPGMLGELADYISDISNIPHPLLSSGAALSIMAILSGQKVMCEGGLHPNLYVVTIAPSSTGKSFPFEAITKVMSQIGAAHLLMGSPVSAAGLISGLHKRKGRALMAIDEFGRALEEMTDANSSSFKYGIITKLLSLYSQSRTSYQGDEYSNRGDATPALQINKPNLSMYGTTVPESFYRNISSDDTTNGFAARLLVLEGIDPDVDYRACDPGKPLPKHLYDYLKELSEYPIDILNDSSGLYDFNPITIPYSDEARQYMDAYRIQTKKWADELDSENNFLATLYRRAYEQASKCAILSRTSNKQIGLESAVWARNYVQTAIDRFYLGAKDYVFNGKFDKAVKEIEIYLKKKRCWIKRKDLCNRFRMPKKRFDEFLDFLIDQNSIEMSKPDTKAQRETTFYRYIAGGKF